MNLSYWERNTWLNEIDFAIVGSGIVGLNCALTLRQRFPDKKIVVFERGMLPSGASTKNAGFACFGSISEIVDDLNRHTEAEVVELVKDRVAGLALLRETIGDAAMNYKEYGGYELFTNTDPELFATCVEKLPFINELLKEVFLDKNEVFSIKNDPFSFKNVQNSLIFNKFEGQIDTGKMMRALLQKCTENDIFILNSVEISSFSSKNNQVSVILNHSEEISVQHLFIATNGFAKRFLDKDVQPARAQVLVTKPIPNLHIKGTFHLDKGYYYFRNINNRVLFGGGRNLDFQGEQTSKLETTRLIQNALEEILHTTILPNTTFEIDTQWSGIMGVGAQKNPILEQLQPNVFCGVRLGGMGVAIGSTIGKRLAEFVY